MKKQAPKLIAFSLLVTLAALMAVAAWIPEKTAGSILAGEQDGGSGDILTPPDTDGDPSQETPPYEEPPSTFVPIPPESSEHYRFTQSLWAEGGVVLNGVHNTSEGTFVVITHSGKEGALNNGGKKTVTVLKMESDGTVSALKNVVGGDTYVDSQLTTDGITLAVCDGENSYIHALSYDLRYDNILKLNRFERGEIFALTQGYLLFTAGNENNVRTVREGCIREVGSVMSGEIIAVYDFDSHYMLVIGGIMGYSVVKINTSLDVISAVTISGKQILTVSPYTDNGKQKFLAVEKNADGVEIVKYDASFENKENRAFMGLAEQAEAFINGESTMLLLHASTPRLYIIGNDNFDLKLSQSENMRGVTAIHDCVTYKNGYWCLFSKSDNLELMKIENDGVIDTRYLAVTSSTAHLTTDASNNAVVFYSADDSLKIIGV